jgi:hypothetical protein
MKNMLVTTLFMLATLAWAVAQQPGSALERSSGQATAPSSQVPGANQSQPSTPGGSDQAGSQDQPSNAPVTEGCLGGSDPNFTLTDRANITYKLNIPPNADTSKLRPHVGESVVVAGDVKDPGKTGSPSIDVQGIGRGTGKCPASDSKGSQPTPKQ